MKLDAKMLAQNFLSGIVGAFAVLSVAHAQTQSSTVPEVIKARDIYLVNEAGKSVGHLSADPYPVLNLEYGTSQIQLCAANDYPLVYIKGKDSHINLSANDEADVTLVHKQFKDGNSVSITSDKEGSALYARCKGQRNVVGLFVSDDDQFVQIKGGQPTFSLADRQGKAIFAKP